MTNSPQWPLLNNAQPNTAPPSDAQPATTQLATAQSNEAQPNTTQPVTAQSNTTQPATAQSNGAHGYAPQGSYLDLPVEDAPVTEAERDYAERVLHQAFREGRLTASEFEQRFTSAMNAARASQLYSAIQNIPAQVSQTLGRVNDQFRGHSGPQPNALMTPGGSSMNTGVAALAHVSGIFSWVFGPAVFYAAARPGSLLRREAAKAFNYQLMAFLIFLGASIVLGVIGLGQIVGLLWLGWLGLSIVGAAKAGSGQDWTNPVTKYTKVAPMPTDGR